MKPNSIFVATFMKGDKNCTGKKWVYPGYVPYTLEWITQVVSEFGLKCHPADWQLGEPSLCEVWRESEPGNTAPQGMVTSLMRLANLGKLGIQVSAKLRPKASLPAIEFSAE